MVIALDTNVFISALDKDQTNFKYASLLIKNIAAGNFDAITSSITHTEINIENMKNNKIDSTNLFNKMNNLITIPADDNICIKASKYRFQVFKKLKLPDVIHLATAIDREAYLFITDDKKLLKIANKELRTINLEQWSEEFLK